MKEREPTRLVAKSEALIAAVTVVVVGVAILFGVEALGFTASVVSFVLWLPQALRTWRSRQDSHALAGVSLSTQILVLANASLWAAYGIETGALWVAAPGAVNAPLAILIISLVVRSRLSSDSESAQTVDSCDLCSKGTQHQIFITAPPGWGSVMGCNVTTRQYGVAVFNDIDIKRLRSESR